MRAAIEYRPEMDQYRVFLGTEDVSIYVVAGQRVMEPVEPGKPRAPFIDLGHEEYMAISSAILEREAPQLAEKAVYAAQRDDAITVRDRLLTMVEKVIDSDLSS
jgi:hypothetical protein